MFAKERQDAIQNLLKQQGAVTTAKLVEQFGVSVETIRRDLVEMAEKGLLSRVHGGAVAMGNMKPFYALDQRSREFNEQKRELSCLAANFVQEGDYLGIDTGSTAVIFAEVLRERFQKITVVTHSADVFEILRDQFPVILCGGHYLSEEKSFYGSLCLKTLDQIRVQKSFIFPSAVSLRFGICDYQSELVPVQQKLTEISDQVFVLADSSKFESRALLKIEDTRPEFFYVTDGLLTEELKTLYAENGMKIFSRTSCEE